MENQKKLWNNAHTQGEIQHYSDTPTDFVVSILPLLKPNSKVLELGCGVGNDSIAFAESGHEVIATDFSDIAIEKDRERFKGVANLSFEVLDMNNPFKFEKNSINAVYARLSLHYFKDEVTQRIFSDIYKVLSPNGFLFFACKSTNDPLYGKGEKIETDMFEHNGHVRHFFSEDYTKKCLDKFEIIKLNEKTDELYGRKSSFIEVIARKQ